MNLTKPLSRVAIPAALIHTFCSSALAAPATYQVISLQNDVAPGTTGATFSTFRNAIINDDGDVTYRGILTTAPGITAANNEGLWLGDTTSSALVQREGELPPGTPLGTAWLVASANQSSFQLSDSGVLAFRQQVDENGMPPVNLTNDQGIWYDPAGVGSLTLVAREGDIDPVTTETFSFVGRPTLTDSADGDLFFMGSLVLGGGVNSGNNTLINGVVGGAITGILREGDATPLLPVGPGGTPNSPAIYGQLANVTSASENGNLLFFANLGAGVPVSSNAALFRRDPAGTVSVVIQEGQVAPDEAGAPTTTNFRVASKFAVNDSGESIFQGSLVLTGGVTTANDAGIWTDAGGSLVRLAREGNAAPGAGGAVFSNTFRSIFIANDGTVVFGAVLDDGSDAIYSKTPAGAVTLVAREGDPAVGTPSTYLALSLPTVNNSGRIAFVSSLALSGGITGTTNSGLWITGNGGGPPTDIFSQEGDIETNTGGTIVSFDLQAPSQALSGVSGGPRSLSDTGVIAVSLGLGNAPGQPRSGVFISGDEAPVFCDVPSDHLENIAAGSGPVAVFWVPPTVTDDSDPMPMVVSTHAPGDTFSPGVTFVTYTATDTSGNVSTFTFRIIVTEIRDTGIETVPQIIAARGDEAVGVAPPNTYRVFNHAFLNSSSEYVFEAGTTIGFFDGIWSDGGGTLGLVALEGTAIPGGGADFLSYTNPSISNDGNVAFNARLSGGTVTTSSDTSAFDETGAQMLGLVIQEGDPAPDAAGAATPREFRILHPIAFNQGDVFASPAHLLIGTGGVTVNSDTGIWVEAPSGSLREFAYESAPAPDLPAGVNYLQVLPQVVSNEMDQLAYITFLSGTGITSFDNQAMFVGTVGGPAPTVVARKGVVAPISADDDSSSKPVKGEDEAPSRFLQFVNVSLNNSGDVAFRAFLRSEGLTTNANNTGVWANRGGTLELVAREGHQAPGFPEGVRFARFAEVKMNDNGDVYFRAWLSGPGINSSNDGGFWTDRGDFLQFVAHEGLLAPNTSGGLYGTVTDFDVDADGDVVCTAFLAVGSGTTTARDNVCYLTDDGSFGYPQINLREGDTYDDGGTERTYTLLTIDRSHNPAGGTGGTGRVVNANGDAILRISATGNSSAVVLRETDQAGPPPVL